MGRRNRCKANLESIWNSFYFFAMDTVTLSSKFQVVIPRSVRVSLGLKPGMKLQVIEYNGRVEFLPVRKPSEFRGLLKGLKPVIKRESDRL
jgi:AbrB family looped-hinge helix DNA binding protein